MDKIKSKKPYAIFLHVAIWLSMCGMPFIVELLNKGSIENAFEVFKIIWVLPFAYFIVYYFNSFFLIDKLLFKKKLVPFILANILFIFLMMKGQQLYYEFMGVGVHIRSLDRGTRLAIYVTGWIPYMLSLGISVAFKMTQEWYKSESERRKLVANKMESELQILKNQLNPHFLFNTLNNIYSLILVSPENAQLSIQQLSELLRYVLYDSSRKYVPLDCELDFVRNYIELMKIRTSSRTTIEVDIPEVEEPGEVIPLLYISLVENAFKHGISANQPSFIRISFEQAKDTLTFITVNSNFPKDKEDKGGSGIGIVNLKKDWNYVIRGSISLPMG